MVQDTADTILLEFFSIDLCMARKCQHQEIGHRYRFR